MLVFGPANSVFDLLTMGILLGLFHASVPLFQTGWFLENIVAQTIIVFSIRTSVVPFYKSHASRTVHPFTSRRSCRGARPAVYAGRAPVLICYSAAGVFCYFTCTRCCIHYAGGSAKTVVL